MSDAWEIPLPGRLPLKIIPGGDDAFKKIFRLNAGIPAVNLVKKCAYDQTAVIEQSLRDCSVQGVFLAVVRNKVHPRPRGEHKINPCFKNQPSCGIFPDFMRMPLIRS